MSPPYCLLPLTAQPRPPKSCTAPRRLVASAPSAPRTRRESVAISTTASTIVLVGRILFVALFAFSARGHIVDHARFVTTARGRLPVPYLAGWPTGIWLLLANLLMVLGIWADIAALMMAAFLVPDRKSTR